MCVYLRTLTQLRVLWMKIKKIFLGACHYKFFRLAGLLKPRTHKRTFYIEKYLPAGADGFCFYIISSKKNTPEKQISVFNINFEIIIVFLY